jgi:uncharacterized small protein (DUF1192 family)
MQAFWKSPSTPLAVRPVGLLLSALAVLSLAGCSDRTADLQQQITSLQNELDRARAEVEAAQKQLAEAPQPTSGGSAKSSGSGDAGNSGATSREAVERNYEDAARVFRTDLEAQLPEVQMGNFTLYRPEVELFPYRSEFSMEVRLRGKPLQIERIPVKAGLDGKWTFPTVTEVGSLIERVKNSPPPTFSTASAAPQPGAAPAGGAPAPESRPDTSIAAPAAANQTVVVQWGDAPAGRPAASPDAPSPARAGNPAAAPAPAAPPAGPTKVMPASRDVQIKF